MNDNWYKVSNEAQIDTPTLLVYWERMNDNIKKVIEIAGSVERLRPHVKTHKLPEIVRLHSMYGFTKFKSATIAESEMIAMNGGEDILLAYQLMSPRISRYIQLILKYPTTKFSTIVDNENTVQQINQACQAANITTTLYLDINNGMNRSGIAPNENALQLYQLIEKLPCVKNGGLHIYDGHIHQPDFEERIQQGNQDFDKVTLLVQALKQLNLTVPDIVVGGSPSFPVHALRSGVDLSPGTYIFWDRGYGDKFKELSFLHAAVVLTRIISKISDTVACIDLGHKAIASENPHPRVYFLNCQVEKFLIHSEEHLVIQSEDLRDMKVGDALYGVPHHICPTVNLQQEVMVIKEQKMVDSWEVVGRQRKITI